MSERYKRKRDALCQSMHTLINANNVCLSYECYDPDDYDRRGCEKTEEFVNRVFGGDGDAALELANQCISPENYWDASYGRNDRQADVAHIFICPPLTLNHSSREKLYIKIFFDQWMRGPVIDIHD